MSRSPEADSLPRSVIRECKHSHSRLLGLIKIYYCCYLRIYGFAIRNRNTRDSKSWLGNEKEVEKICWKTKPPTNHFLFSIFKIKNRKRKKNFAILRLATINIHFAWGSKRMEGWCHLIVLRDGNWILEGQIYTWTLHDDFACIKFTESFILLHMRVSEMYYISLFSPCTLSFNYSHWRRQLI